MARTRAAVRQALAGQTAANASKAPKPPSPISARARRLAADPRKQQGLADARKWVADNYLRDRKPGLKPLRLAAGLSQQQLADAIGSTQAQIARLEAGKQDVQVGTLLKIARALDASPESVFLAFVAGRELASEPAR